jgi:hypothetical protein
MLVVQSKTSDFIGVEKLRNLLIQLTVKSLQPYSCHTEELAYD